MTFDSIFVSPHPDDIALSCGGIVARDAQQGRPLVVTVFGGLDGASPQGTGELARKFHALWGFGDATVEDIIAARRAEDDAAMARLGATGLWLTFPDALYRRGPELARVLTPMTEPDRELVDRVGPALVSIWRASPRARIHMPLAIGGHVDHRVCFAASRWLEEAGAQVSFYEDFPYARVVGRDARLAEISRPLQAQTIDVTQWIDARVEAVECYRSQVPSLFTDDTPSAAIRTYATEGSAFVERLWT